MPQPEAAAARTLIAWLRRSRHVPTLARGRAWDEPDHLSPARHPSLSQVMRELRAVGIRERFRFLWAHDGSGVETWEPDVIHIDRSLRRTTRAPAAVRRLADGVMGLTIADVARHEIGHALQFARPWVTRGRGFRRLFGDARKAYRVGNPVEEVARRLVRHDALRNPRYRRMVSVYAATHPYERFAEAFRVALQHGCDLERLRAWCATTRKHPVVVEQLAFVVAWVRRLAARPGGRSTARARGR